jgi:release factor glutamine methyltransferase
MATCLWFKVTNIKNWIKHSVSELTKSGIESARLDCLLLLEDQLEKPREWILAHDDTEIHSSDLLPLNTKLAQRTKRTPLAYIRNQQEFYGRPFYVDKNVLIPRPESESIITLLNKIAINQPKGQSFWLIDVGTGSGILAITAKLELPELHIVATDVSDVALSVAKQNADRFETDIEFTNTSLLEGLAFTTPTIVLANLPYVPKGLVTSEEIKREPKLALFSGKDGLDHYNEFWEQVGKLQYQPNYVITESLNYQHKQMISFAAKAGYVLLESEILAQLFELKS